MLSSRRTSFASFQRTTISSRLTTYCSKIVRKPKTLSLVATHLAIFAPLPSAGEETCSCSPTAKSIDGTTSRIPRVAFSTHASTKVRFDAFAGRRKGISSVAASNRVESILEVLSTDELSLFVLIQQEGDITQQQAHTETLGHLKSIRVSKVRVFDSFVDYAKRKYEICGVERRRIDL